MNPVAVVGGSVGGSAGGSRRRSRRCLLTSGDWWRRSGSRTVWALGGGATGGDRGRWRCCLRAEWRRLCGLLVLWRRVDVNLSAAPVRRACACSRRWRGGARPCLCCRVLAPSVGDGDRGDGDRDGFDLDAAGGGGADGSRGAFAEFRVSRSLLSRAKRYRRHWYVSTPSDTASAMMPTANTTVMAVLSLAPPDDVPGGATPPVSMAGGAPDAERDGDGTGSGLACSAAADGDHDGDGDGTGDGNAALRVGVRVGDGIVVTEGVRVRVPVFVEDLLGDALPATHGCPDGDGSTAGPFWAGCLSTANRSSCVPVADNNLTSRRLSFTSTTSEPGNKWLTAMAGWLYEYRLRSVLPLLPMHTLTVPPLGFKPDAFVYGPDVSGSPSEPSTTCLSLNPGERP